MTQYDTKNVHEDLKTTAETFGRTLGKLTRKAATLRAEVADRGGIGEIVQEYGEFAGQKIGTGVGHIAKAADGLKHEMTRLPKPADVYAAGEVDVNDYSARGQEIGAKVAGTLREKTGAVTTHIGDFVASVRAGVNSVATDISEVVNAGVSGAQDYSAPNEDRSYRVTKTGKVYNVNSESKAAIAGTITYAKQVAASIPSATAGRPELLDFIADYAVTDKTALEAKWNAKKMVESNAYRRVLNE